jgi:anti-sigma B factor antagonist
MLGGETRPLASAEVSDSDRKARHMVEYFSLALTLRHDRARLNLRGELDSAATDELSARFDEVCAERPSLLLVDLTELSFCDSSGIQALVQLAALCASNDIELRLFGAQSNVHRIFELTDTAELLHLANDACEY